MKKEKFEFKKIENVEDEQYSLQTYILCCGAKAFMRPFYGLDEISH